MLLIAWTTFYNESEKRAVNNYTAVSPTNELNGSHVVLLRSSFLSNRCGRVNKVI